MSLFWRLSQSLESTDGGIHLALQPSDNVLPQPRKNKMKLLLGQIKKYLTYKSVLVIILTNVLTGCGPKTSSGLLTSCVDMTTYVDNSKVAAQVITKERICEQERLRSMGINIGED